MTVRQVDVAEARRLRDAGATVVDVREPVEWQAGHIAGALHIPLGDLPRRAPDELPDLAAPLLLYCRSGARSARAATFLVAQGYADVANLNGLVADWEATGGAWEVPAAALSTEEQRRYARQVAIPEIGAEGQRRLLDARVLIVGAGGLGSPAALYLAAAGIGTIGLVDDDRVAESNLQRQVLHGTDRIGQAKVDSAERMLLGINPGVRVVKHGERLDAASVDRLLDGYEVVLDGSDNLETRYLLNDAAVRLRRPVVHGSVYRWEAQVTTFVPFEGPCYRCLHPNQPPDELVPDCDVAGVLGVLPGIAGTLQANEVLKLILGVGRPLVGRLLLFDAAGTTFDEVRVERDPSCPVCGEPARRLAAPVPA